MRQNGTKFGGDWKVDLKKYFVIYWKLLLEDCQRWVGSGVKARRLTRTLDKTIKMCYDAQVYNYTLLAKAIGMSQE